jgi:osmoprotectant transport system substrate-binding protein
LALTAFLLAGAACSDTSSGPTNAERDDVGLRVASFDFAESELLAEVYAQAAEGSGITVERLGAVGPREIVHPAMRNDLIDLVPEYVGTALRFVGVVDPAADPSEAAASLKVELAPFELLVLSPASAVDTNVFVVAEVVADEIGLETVSDLADAGLRRFGGPAECPDRPLCLVGLAETYGVVFEQFVAQPSLAFTGEALRRREIDVGLMFSTSPELNDPELVALVDDLSLQPPDNVVPMLRQSAVTRWGPELVSVLDDVSSALTTGDLRRMNAEVAAGASIEEVARDWLAGLG